MFVFDRLQVIDDLMDGWGDTIPSPPNGSTSKKRRFEMGSSSDRASKRRAADLDEEIDEL